MRQMVINSGQVKRNYCEKKRETFWTLGLLTSVARCHWILGGVNEYICLCLATCKLDVTQPTLQLNITVAVSIGTLINQFKIQCFEIIEV